MIAFPGPSGTSTWRLISPSSSRGTSASGGIGRRARFRSVCPKGCGGSTPPSRTTTAVLVRRDERVHCFLVPSRRVIMLPGIVLPASLAYQALIDVLGSDVQAMAKDLEVYAGSAPPPDYTLELEVEGIVRLADEQGWDRFHLVGYSAGGASITAFAARHPDRVRSLALLEPAWAGNWDDMSDAHRRLRQEYQQLERLPPDQFISEFMRLGVRPGVELPPPPPGDPPPWMDLRPAGIRAVLKTFAPTILTDQHCKGSTGRSTLRSVVSVIPTTT